MKNVEIEINNLKCMGCVGSISKELEEIDGINRFSIDLDRNLVQLEIEDQIDLLDVKEKLKSMGYPSVDQENRIVDKAKSYLSCMVGRINA